MNHLMSLIAVIHSSSMIATVCQQKQKAREGILGAWTVVAVEENGRPIPKDSPRIAMTTVHFGKRCISVTRLGETSLIDSYRLDPRTNPKSIDIPLLDGTLKGVYEIKGDTLKLCIPAVRSANVKKPRPAKCGSCDCHCELNDAVDGNCHRDPLHPWQDQDCPPKPPCEHEPPLSKYLWRSDS